MHKRSSKGDENQAAARLVRLVTEDEPERAPENGKPPTAEKNPAAVALGRLGGQKGGKARAKKLSAKRRSEIARKAAEKRWKKDGGR